MKRMMSIAVLVLIATAGVTAPARVTTVTMKDMKFEPAVVTIHRGETVAWQNLSPIIHNIVDVPSESPKAGIMTLPKGAESFQSGLMNYGAAYVHTFDTPGTYNYACTMHIANKMIGKVVVK